MDSLRGKLLIAAPELGDPNFVRSVVLMIQHDQQGAMGLILNRPTETPIARVWEKISESQCMVDQPLRIGGPVQQGALFSLHQNFAQGESEIMEGIFLSTERDNVEKILTEPSSNVRVFVGYAGWSPNQLESEIAEGAWVLFPATSEHIFCDDQEDLWETVRDQITATAIHAPLKIRNIPQDPSVN